MKQLSLITALAALSFVIGCNRANTERSSGENRDTTVQVNRRETTENANTVTPTSRDPNAPSRNYQAEAKVDANAPKPPDNTAVNARDRDDNTLTPGDQGTSEADREVTRNIRRALMKNDQLSTTAKNIKIITVNGKVTLRGPVN